MKTFVLPAGQNWRKLGYTLHGDSTEYRSVLADNPEWSLDMLPPVGTVLVTSGGQTSGSMNIGLTPTTGSESQDNLANIYPFRNMEHYQKSLSRYNPSSLMNVEANNGFTMDSVQALTGMQ